MEGYILSECQESKKTTATNLGYITPQKQNNIHFTYIMWPNCRTFVFFNDNFIIIKYITII